MSFFTELGKSIRKFRGKHKRPQGVKATLIKKNNAGLSQRKNSKSTVLTRKQTRRPIEQEMQKQTITATAS
jgi:hypothetical protein